MAAGGKNTRPHVGDNGMPVLECFYDPLSVLADPGAGDAVQPAERADRLMIEATAAVMAIFIGPFEQRIGRLPLVAGEVADYHGHGCCAAAGGRYGFALAVDDADGRPVIKLVDLRHIHDVAGHCGRVVAVHGSNAGPVVGCIAHGSVDEIAPEAVVFVAHHFRQQLLLLCAEVVLLHHIQAA